MTYVKVVEQTDTRLGRQCVHDERSRGYALHATPGDPRDHPDINVRIYGPRITPRQRFGCCTLVDQCVRANAAGNRVKGVVLGLPDAERMYPPTTRIDPFPGEFDPATGVIDTGSSSLAAAKTAQAQGLIVSYHYVFTGAAGVLAALIAGDTVGVGTWWYPGMFRPDPATHLVRPTGNRAGGHQWSIIGWRRRPRAFVGLCWWGPQFGNRGRFLLGYDDADDLLADDGDAQITRRYRAGLEIA